MHILKSDLLANNFHAPLLSFIPFFLTDDQAGPPTLIECI